MRFHFPVGLSSLTIVIDDESSDAEPDIRQKLDAKNLVPSESSRTLTSGDDSASGSDSDSDGGETSEGTPKQVVKKITKPESSSSDSESDSTSSSENEKMSVSPAPVKHTTDESEESSSEESSDSSSDSPSSMDDEEEAKVGLSSASPGPIILPKLGSPEKNYEGQGK